MDIISMLSPQCLVASLFTLISFPLTGANKEVIQLILILELLD